jgi:hypothetical protein
MESPASPTAPPPSRPDALDELEARALNVLRSGDESDWEPLLDAIDHIEQAGTLYPHPPPIDPSEGRRSSAELRRLIDAVRWSKPDFPPPRTRAGYALEGAPAGEASVLPAFAAAIGAPHLRDGFPDLWALDAALWERLDKAGMRELACLWLESPGRRLVQDIGVLTMMPHLDAVGASAISPSRIDAASGLNLGELHRGHRELHLAVPGASFEEWEPEPTDKAEQVLRALHLLEEGSPLALRGAALSWLLNRAADDPFYTTVEGLRRDLRDDLPLRLSTALAAWVDAAPAAAVPQRLEALALQHAARIVAADPPVNEALRGWAIARWLQGCLRRSPFFGADEEVLAAHLGARRQADPQLLLKGADALHPARFSVDGNGLNLAEIAFMAGVLSHYQRDPDRTLLPTPVPIVHALQRLASHPVRAAEEEADAALAAKHNALEWPEGYPISPPLAARRLMTDLRIDWIAQLSEAAQRDAIERFSRDPAHHAWLAFAVEREGQHLRGSARSRAVEVFRALAATEQMVVEAHVTGTFGAGILEWLTMDDADRILEITGHADPAWRPFVVDALAGAAERLGRDALWTRALDRLVALMQEPQFDDKARLNAALFALRRASASKLSGRDALLGRIATLVAAPPFTDHLGLRREIRRLGLPTPAAAGSKR